MSAARCLSTVTWRGVHAPHLCGRIDEHSGEHKCYRCGLTWVIERPVRTACGDTIGTPFLEAAP